jgi:Holliday junction resolvasome RuvABC endonuclease subunit
MTAQAGMPKRILAVNPGMQYLSVAFFEGEELVWYRIKTFFGRKTLPHMRREVQQYLTTLLQMYSPDTLAVEEPFYAQSLLSKNLLTLTEDIKTWGRWKRLRVCSYLPTAVKAHFCGDEKTKQSLAEAMVERYPFLRRYLSILSWRRRYWFHVFDAVGLGLLCHNKLVSRKISL